MQVNIRIIFKIDITCACNTHITLDITYSLGLFPNQFSVEKLRNKHIKNFDIPRSISNALRKSRDLFFFFWWLLTMLDQSACARTYYFVFGTVKVFVGRRTSEYEKLF